MGYAIVVARSGCWRLRNGCRGGREKSRSLCLEQVNGGYHLLTERGPFPIGLFLCKIVYSLLEVNSPFGIEPGSERVGPIQDVLGTTGSEKVGIAFDGD